MTTLDGSEPVRDGICLLTPSAQTQVDVFGGQWAFELPLEGVITGVGKGFANPHPVVHMAEQIFGSLEGMSCLELGPFEGEISYALHHSGAQVTSIEVRRLNFLKCLVVKNVLDLSRVTFGIGDFMKHLEEPGPQYDICIASGVLYHMREPVRLIELLSKRCKRILIGTNYIAPQIFDLANIPDSSGLSPVGCTFPDPEGELFEHGGLTVRQYRMVYPFDPDIHAIYGAGGPEMFSNMLTDVDILRAVEHFGFRVVGEVKNDPNADRGPNLYFCAERVDA